MMFLSLPLITPRDSHELWYGSSQPYRSSPSYNSNSSDPNQPSSRRHGNNSNNALNGRALISATAPSNTLAALSLEERALRARKQNIASFGYAWIKPAGCAKTMLGMREEEAEREEAAAAAAAEMNAAAMELGMGTDGFGGPQAAGLGVDGAGQDDQMMERDLDDDIPDADADADGLVEEGEEGLEEEEEEEVDEDGLMGRDLDDDIPEAFPDDDDDDDEEEEDDEDEHDDFDNQPDLDDDIPAAEGGEGLSNVMARDLDDDVPDAAEDGSEQEQEWQHTDTEAEDDDYDDDAHDPFAEHLRRTSTTSSGLPPQPSIRRESGAQRRFLQRWSGGGDAFDSSGMMLDDEDLRASLRSQGSRRSGFGRRFSRRGGPRDSLE